MASLCEKGRITPILTIQNKLELGEGAGVFESRLQTLNVESLISCKIVVAFPRDFVQDAINRTVARFHRVRSRSGLHRKTGLNSCLISQLDLLPN